MRCGMIKRKTRVVRTTAEKSSIWVCEASPAMLQAALLIDNSHTAQCCSRCLRCNKREYDLGVGMEWDVCSSLRSWGDSVATLSTLHGS